MRMGKLRWTPKREFSGNGRKLVRLFFYTGMRAAGGGSFLSSQLRAAILKPELKIKTEKTFMRVVWNYVTNWMPTGKIYHIDWRELISLLTVFRSNSSFVHANGLIELQSKVVIFLLMNIIYWGSEAISYPNISSCETKFLHKLVFIFWHQVRSLGKHLLKFAHFYRWKRRSLFSFSRPRGVTGTYSASIAFSTAVNVCTRIVGVNVRRVRLLLASFAAAFSDTVC